jgi:hypothetical protein
MVIGNWRSNLPPTEGAHLAGICLDRSGLAVDWLLGLAFL